MDKRLDIFELFKNEGKLGIIYLYPSIETETDPTEHITSETLLNAIPMKALVNQVGFSALRWKFWGQLPTGSIQVICEPQFENALLISRQIKYNGNTYYIYKDDAKRFALQKRENYLVVILDRKS